MALSSRFGPTRLASSSACAPGRLVPVRGPCHRLRSKQLQAVEVDTAAVPAPVTTLFDVKAALLDALHGTDRGLSARSEVRAEINELISQLEAKNPAGDPQEVLANLNGTWRLYYTSNSELIAVLALGKLPLVQVGDITQKIDVATNSVDNTVQLTVAFSKTSLSTTAVYDVRSPKRLQLRFEKGIVQTPRLLSDIDVPSTISVLGQAVDLSPLKSALQPLSDRVSDVIRGVSDVIAQSPDLQFPIGGDQAQTWLLNTYVDSNMRISRGDGGSIFLCVKDS